MNQSTNEKFSAQLKQNLAIHQAMLSDGMRNKLMLQVLKDYVSKDTNLLDVGAGTGVWAVIAAKLGAKRVVAVELEECLIPIIYQHAKENGVADKIEIIHANIDDVVLNEKFDIIISEIFGADAYGKKTINSFIKLRKRFLARNGKLVPQKMHQYVVPIHLKNSVDKIGKNLPFESSFFKDIRLNYNQNYSIKQSDEIEILAAPKILLEVDFQTIEEPPNLINLSQSWGLDNVSRINAFAVYNHSFYTDNIELNSFKSSSWVVGIYEFESFSENVTDIKFELTMENKKLNWKISLPANPQIKTQVYSPGFSVARIKMAQATTPHKKF